MEDTGVDGRGEEVVGRRDGVDVTSEVQVELVHGNDLRVASPRSAALDAKGWPHGRLAHARKDLCPEVGAQSLLHPDGSRALALAKRRGVDAGYDNVVAVFLACQAITNGQGHLGFARSIQFELFGENARVPRHLRDGL